MAELELKFRLSDRHVKTALAVLKRQAGARPLADEALEAVYFDTAQRERFLAPFVTHWRRSKIPATDLSTPSKAGRQREDGTAGGLEIFL